MNYLLLKMATTMDRVLQFLVLRVPRFQTQDSYS
jgi:hypothetical protein